jgi:hypothetical protein
MHNTFLGNDLRFYQSALVMDPGMPSSSQGWGSRAVVGAAHTQSPDRLFMGERWSGLCHVPWAQGWSPWNSAYSCGVRGMATNVALTHRPGSASSSASSERTYQASSW